MIYTDVKKVHVYQYKYAFNITNKKLIIYYLFNDL